MIPPQPSAKPPSLRAPEPQHSAPVPAMAPVDSGAPQGAQPSSPAMRAPEPQQSAPVLAMAPADSGAPQGTQPSAPSMRIPSRSNPPLSRPWRRLTRVRHKELNPLHNHHVLLSHSSQHCCPLRPR